MTTQDNNECRTLACGCAEGLVRTDAHQCKRFTGKRAADYPWIVEYCAYVGASDAIVKELVDRARREEAPLDAFWFWIRQGQERWLTVPDMSTLTRARLDLPPMPESER